MSRRSLNYANEDGIVLKYANEDGIVLKYANERRNKRKETQMFCLTINTSGQGQANESRNFLRKRRKMALKDV